ncbi:M23 family metallopeptidase [Streptomyces sp. NPDC050504]|uniref:M23 family metallopeptidase n=1 Tax=Streptomyces sp. NPDC050504 TaxID=3365618 RepID=UPI0037B6B917
MRTRRTRGRRRCLGALALCALLTLAPDPSAHAADGPAARPGAGKAAGTSAGTGAGTGSAAGGSDGPRAGARVARLYEQVARATDAYERGRRAAGLRRAEARRLEVRLARQRRVLAGHRAGLGAVARSQYRAGAGPVADTARVLLAGDPERLLRGRYLAHRADLALARMLDRAVLAERVLVRDERRARDAWRDLEARTARLALLRRSVEARLKAVRARLERDAERSVAAGKCDGVVRMAQRGLPDGGAWVAPLESYALSAGFDRAGERWAHRHTGQDFAVAVGTPVRAAGAGRVVSVSCGGGFGIEVVLGHANGWYTQYAHLSAAAVEPGERVRAGQWVGQAGTTGNSTGPHLHFEVRLTPYLGSGVDPMGWMREHGVVL